MPESDPSVPVLDNYAPEEEAAVTISRTEANVIRLRGELEREEEQLEREQGAKAMSTPSVRQLAVDLHNNLCPADHLAQRCTWLTAPNANEPEATDWTEAAHARWLGIASFGVYLQRIRPDAAWLVVEPGASVSEAKAAVLAFGYVALTQEEHALLGPVQTLEEKVADLVAAGYAVTPPPPPEE